MGAILLLAWVTDALYTVFRGRPTALPFDPEQACRDTSFSCGSLAGIVAPVLSLAVASAIFLLIRLRQVRRPYVRVARDRPRDVVPTAGSILGDVVGRDALCRVIIDDVRDPHTRRPHVVVGGVGTGKTALLVQLTRLLAQHGAVPVPVRLRDAQDALDFRELAHQRFLAESEGRLLSTAEGEKIWRHLCSNQKIVVLADGLEEALCEGKAERDRDNLIRLAIRQANRDRLPLIVTSRPHDPLREMEAAIVELEPLSEEAALEYVRATDSSEDERRLDWVVETADVTEAPLYLQITRQLHRAGLMEYLSPARDGGRLDTRGVDRAELRVRLLETWTNALIDGHLRPGVSLSAKDRRATVTQLSALACIGLKQDLLHVRYDEFDALRRATPRSPIITAMEDELQSSPDIQLAATWGTQLGLVEARGDAVRFPHSIMQAYLGSRLMGAAIADARYLDEALENPGREVLIALVMHSRRKVSEARPTGASEVRVDAAQPGEQPERLQDALCAHARDGRGPKALDLYAAALEIDSVDVAPRHEEIGDELCQRWPKLAAPDQRTLEHAKLNVVRRFGEAARVVVQHGRQEPARAERARRAEPGYRQLYSIIRAEESYPVRLAAAQEIGAGGDLAFDALAPVLGPHPSPAALSEPNADPGGASADGAGPRADARHPADDAADVECRWRELVARAWLAPLLVGSVSPQRSAAARANLEQWLEFVTAADAERGEFGLSLQAALAQGFKYAANRRRRHTHARFEARGYLAEQARDLLRSTTFWFSRLTLLHALCLWSLPDEPDGHAARGRRDADPRALVTHWTMLASGQREHPFVLEARVLAAWALQTGQPERFIWIDESGVVANVGSRPANPVSRRRHNLWIPPSTGWTALHPRAQQLVADVLLLLNLAERGQPAQRTQRLRRTHRPELPPCLTGNRSPLDPTRTVGRAGTAAPGSNCSHGCPIELCPYPPRGETNYRIELSEAFCRRQRTLLNGGSVRRRAAPWQGALASDLRRFWMQMEQRAQPSELDHEPASQQRRRSARPVR